MDGPCTTERTYTVLFPFCGVGGGALGFRAASARLERLGLAARFRVLGGIEYDEGTARDFERLTGAPCLAMDVRAVTPPLLREWFGVEAPDVVFFSPPCKGASGLLSEELAASEKYAAMNELALVWLRLMFETWPGGPRLVLMENVPRIRTRAAAMMREARRLLRANGYVTHDAAHDCGELGGLAQHRDRLLFVGRHAKRVPALLYQPTKRRVRAIGEVLAALPLPGDPAAGPLHRLPALDAITALRLALIPAGGDWKALPAEVLLPPKLASVVGKGKPSRRTPFNDVYRVVRWDAAAGCVTAGATPTAGGMCVADPRPTSPCHPWTYGVLGWDDASHTVTGNTFPGGGPFSVAEPRVQSGFPGTYGVVRWDDPSVTITGRSGATTGSLSVADPRVTCKTRENSGIYGVVPWTEPAGTVVGHACHDNGRFSVADPRWPASVPFPVIIAEDGTWHRPLTTLECAVLQSFPAVVDGEPLTLDGRNTGRWRVRIGDAVPPDAAQAIARQMLLTLLHADATGFALASGGDVWVGQREAVLQ